MNERRQLVADLMAELTGRFEDLATLAATQQRAQTIDTAVIGKIAGEARSALTIANAAIDLTSRENNTRGTSTSDPESSG